MRLLALPFGFWLLLLLLTPPEMITAARPPTVRLWPEAHGCRYNQSMFSRMMAQIETDPRVSMSVSTLERLVVVAVTPRLTPGVLDRWALAQRQFELVQGQGAEFHGIVTVDEESAQEVKDAVACVRASLPHVHMVSDDLMQRHFPDFFGSQVGTFRVRRSDGVGFSAMSHYFCGIT